MLDVDPSSAVPIWKQIEEEMRRLVATGILAPGTVIPSVRELARELRVNPATVSKAYQELTDDGLLAVRRGEGTFVASVPAAPPGRKRKAMLGAAALRYASVAQTIGANQDEAIEAIEKAYEHIEDANRRRTANE